MTQMDKYFKNRLRHYNSDVPEYLWENIEHKLPNPNKTKLRLISSLVVLAIFALVMLSLYLVDFNQNFQEKNNTRSIPLAFVKNEISEKVKGSNQNINQINDNQLADLDQINLSPDIPSARDISQSKLNNYSNKPFTQNLTNAWANEIEEADEGNQSSIISQDVHSMSLHGDQKSEEAEINVGNKETRNIVSIPTLENSNINSISPFDFTSSFESNTQKVCPSFQKTVPDFNVTAYASVDNIKNILSPKSWADSEYLHLRRQSETLMTSFSAGIRLGYQLNNKSGISGGLQYAQINEKFEYIDPESTQTRLVTIKDYVYSNGKIIDSIITEELIIIPGNVELTVYNKYKSVDIPILFNYQVKDFNKWGFGFTAGPIFNITSIQKGMIISPEEKHLLVNITSGHANQADVFKSNFGVSMYGALALNYNLSEKIDLVFEPNVRYNLSSVTKESYSVNQRFLVSGLMTGIKYKF